MKKKRLNIILIVLPIMLLLQHCEPDHETNDVSKVSSLPKFKYYGGQFTSFIVGSVTEYSDPGVAVFIDNEECFDCMIDRVVVDPVNPNKAGVYVYDYRTTNKDGLISWGRRIIAVTHEDVTDNEDLSGKYLLTYFGLVDSKVKKLNDKGWYSATEVLGIPGIETKGEFVVIGNGELFILPGDSFYGRYDLYKGYYTPTSLSWDILFIDEPNEGIKIPVTLIKQDD